VLGLGLDFVFGRLVVMHHWPFPKTGTMGALASKAEIGVQAPGALL